MQRRKVLFSQWIIVVRLHEPEGLIQLKLSWDIWLAMMARGDLKRQWNAISEIS